MSVSSSLCLSLLPHKVKQSNRCLGFKPRLQSVSLEDSSYSERQEAINVRVPEGKIKLPPTVISCTALFVLFIFHQDNAVYLYCNSTTVTVWDNE